MLEFEQAAQTQAALVLLAQRGEHGDVEPHRRAGAGLGVGDTAMKRGAAAWAGVALFVHFALTLRS